MNPWSPNPVLGNGVCPRAALGFRGPIWRLGALVSLPHCHGNIIMVLRPDKSLWRRSASVTAGKTLPPPWYPLPAFTGPRPPAGTLAKWLHWQYLTHDPKHEPQGDQPRLHALGSLRFH